MVQGLISGTYSELFHGSVIPVESTAASISIIYPYTQYHIRVQSTALNCEEKVPHLKARKRASRKGVRK
jgi:hypothetical protein